MHMGFKNLFLRKVESSLVSTLKPALHTSMSKISDPAISLQWHEKRGCGNKYKA